MIPTINNMELYGSTPNVNIVVQADDYEVWGHQTRRYYITQDDDKNNITSPLADLNTSEKNMGDPQTLVDFVNWATDKYPAEHYVLIMCGHGGGWLGICPDVTSQLQGQDGYINISELESALSSCPHLEILFLYACEMGQIEVFYQLKDHVDIIIATEATGADDSSLLGLTLKNLTSNPSFTPLQLAQLFVDYYFIKGLSPFFGVLTCKIGKMKEAVNNLAEALLEHCRVSPFKVHRMVRIAFRRSCMYDYIKFDNDKKIKLEINKRGHELYEFAKKISVLSKNRMRMLDIYNAALEVLSAIDNSSIIKSTQNPSDTYHGIAISSPPFIFKYLQTRGQYKTIDFAQETKWDEFLNWYY